jgi:exodeoxyribonuclease VII small subunit
MSTSPARKPKSKATSSNDKVPSDWQYEATVAQIEEIIAQIEEGSLELDQVFSQFATAVQYLKECDDFLRSRQDQMELLIETLGDDASH